MANASAPQERVSKAKPPAYLALREEAIQRAYEWVAKNAKAVEKLAALHWDHTLAIALYIEAFEAGRESRTQASSAAVEVSDEMVDRGAVAVNTVKSASGRWSWAFASKIARAAIEAALATPRGET